MLTNYFERFSVELSKWQFFEGIGCACVFACFLPVLFRFLPAEVRCIDLKKAAQEAAASALTASTALRSAGRDVLVSLRTVKLQSLARRGRGMCDSNAQRWIVCHFVVWYYPLWCQLSVSYSIIASSLIVFILSVSYSVDSYFFKLQCECVNQQQQSTR